MDPFDINKEVSMSKYTGNHLRRTITAAALALIMCLTAVYPASAAVLEAEGK